MKKRLLCLLTVIVLMTAFFPLEMFAAGSVTLGAGAIPNKYRGDSVTVSGNTVLDEVTVKVLRPNNTILYINVLEGGDFTDTFTLPSDTDLGVYTVIAGKGQDTAVTTFTVKSSSSGGGGSTTTTSSTGTEPEIKVLDDGTAKVVTEPSLDEESHTAVSDVSTELMEKALEKAIETSDGIRTVEFEMPEVEGAEQYALRLPANMLSGEENVRIEMKTPAADLTIPGNMFRAGSGDAGYIEIRAGLADISDLDEAVLTMIGGRPVIELTALLDGEAVSWSNPDAPVTVTMAYTPTEEELKDPEHIVVWYIDGQGNITSIPNGRYDSETGKVVFSTTHFSLYAVAFVNKTFSDMQSYSWAKHAIEVLASKGIIKGISATSYSPGLNIARADFVTLLVRALELEASFSSNFEDVKISDYYYNEVGIAKKLGIAKGVGENRFNPKAKITREDMMVLTARALEAAGVILNDAGISGLSPYKDSGSISSYAKGSVAALVENGIITGDGGLIHPKKYTTRAEAAVVIYRIYINLLT